MLLRRAPGFVAALILLPLSILAPAIPGYTAMVCRLTGTVVLADCGQASAEDAPTPAQSVWQAGSCCDTFQVTFSRAPAETPLAAPLAMGTVVPVARFQILPMVPQRPFDMNRPAPSGIGPPRRLVTQTFLI
jgi:hypothetical protein